MFLHNLVNIYGMKDAYGTGDNIIVIANMKFVLLPNEKIKFKKA